MKRLVKWSAGLMAFGFLLIVAGGFLGGFRALSLWNLPFWGSSYQQMELEGNPSFSSIDVDIRAGDVSLSYGDSYSASMRWNNTQYALSAHVEDDTLMVRNPSVAPNLPNASASVHITVPRDSVLKQVSVHTSMGDVSLSRVTVSGTLSVSTSMGDIESSGITAQGGADFTSSMGDLTLHGDFPCDLNATADMGDLELEMVQPQSIYTIKASTDMGELEIDGEDVDSSTYQNGSGASKLTAASSMGDLSLSFEE